ncbi:MAG: M48 family metallopeptidase [Bacteriovoracaceae bacterium]
MKFNTTLFHSDAPRERISGVVQITSHKTQFKSDDFHIDWYSERLQMEIAGSNQHLIYFKEMNEPKNCFYFEKSHEAIQFLKSLNIDTWNSEIESHKKKSLFGKGLLASAIIGFVLLIIGLFSSKSFIVDQVVNSIPYKYEKQIGEKLLSLQGVSLNSKEDFELLEELRILLRPLINNLDEQYKDVKIYLSPSLDLNAYALPGGIIVINKGALIKSESALPILGVAAHELAHVTERHVLQGIIQSLGLFALVQVTLGDFTGIIAVLGDQGGHLLRQEFSRDKERVADKEGFNLLVDSGVDPRGMQQFFELLLENQTQLQKNIEKHLSLLSTHPETKERVSYLDSLYNELNPRLKKKLGDPSKESFLKIKKILSNTKKSEKEK